MFVGQDKEWDTLEVGVGDHQVEGGLGLLDPVPVVGVHRVDDGVALGVVLVPKRLQFLLPAEVPEVEPDPLSVDLADVESHGGRDLARILGFVVSGEFGFG